MNNQDNAKCWAIHITGPDDLLPVPSKNIGQICADVLNKSLTDTRYLGMNADVVEWVHGYEEWKAGSEQFAREYADWIKQHITGTEG